MIFFLSFGNFQLLNLVHWRLRVVRRHRCTIAHFDLAPIFANFFESVGYARVPFHSDWRGGTVCSRAIGSNC